MERSIEERLGGAILDSEGVPEDVQEKPLSADYERSEPEEAPEETPEEESEEASADPSEAGPEEVSASDLDEEIPVVEVEIDGEVIEVPEKYKDYFLRQSDYTQKTQALADQRREVELQQKQIQVQQREHEFLNEIQPDINNLGYLQAQIQQMEQDLQTNLQSLSSEDLFRKKIEMDGLREQANALKSQLEVKYGEFEKAQEQSYKELLNEGAQVLKQSIPNWSEDKQKAIRDFALSEGFSEQEVSTIIDPRHVRILWKASQYDALKDKAVPVVEKAKAAIKPKARSKAQSASDKKLAVRNKLRSKNLSSKDKAAVIQQELGERFG